MNNFEYFTKNQAELYQDYPDKYLVIKDCKVEGDFDDFDSALNWAASNFELGSFIIQQCTGSAESYNQTFHSRVVFA
jgi:hypothetical protein|nr:MAG TPA: hypothetical protein [Caudoviricetes sp.]